MSVFHKGRVFLTQTWSSLLRPLLLYPVLIHHSIKTFKLNLNCSGFKIRKKTESDFEVHWWVHLMWRMAFNQCQNKKGKSPALVFRLQTIWCTFTQQRGKQMLNRLSIEMQETYSRWMFVDIFTRIFQDCLYSENTTKFKLFQWRPTQKSNFKLYFNCLYCVLHYQKKETRTC